MRTGDLYDYALLRVVPRVEREEFINAGVLLSCPTRAISTRRVGQDSSTPALMNSSRSTRGTTRSRA